MERRRVFLGKLVSLFLVLSIQVLFVNRAWADTTVYDPNNYTIQVNTNGDGTGVFTVTDDPNGSAVNVIVADDQLTTIDSTAFVVNGTTSLGSTLSVTDLSTLLGCAAITGGIDNNYGGITEAGAISGVTTLDANGLATLNGGIDVNGGNFTVATNGNTSVGGTLGVTGLSSLDGGIDVNSGNFTVATNGNTSVGGTLGVTGATTLTGALTANGGATVNNGATIYSGNSSGNQMIVDGTSSRFVSADTYSNATVSDGSVSLLADSDEFGTNARSSLSMTPTSSSLLVNTDSGVSHGISIGQTSTVISGGTTSTSLTLDDNGATFQDDDTSGPATVTGVADGVADYDAVNMRQYRKLEDRVDKSWSGIASVAAIAAIPGPVPGKTSSLGLGFGNFESRNAVAVGGKALVGKNKDITLTAGLGYCDDTTTVSAGVGWSF